MSPKEFLATIYLGDRACKAIVIDTWNSSVKIQVDCISRVRSAKGTWDFYTDEDIENGFLVFTAVKQFEIVNSGRIPNDLINGIEVVSESPDGALIEISVDSVDDAARHHETLVRIRCGTVHLEDPTRPGAYITS